MDSTDNMGSQAAEKLAGTKVCGCDSNKFVPIFNMVLGLVLIVFSVMTFMTWIPHGTTVIVVYCFRIYQM